jgi:hypothetical protein
LAADRNRLSGHFGKQIRVARQPEDLVSSDKSVLGMLEIDAVLNGLSDAHTFPRSD